MLFDASGAGVLEPAAPAHDVPARDLPARDRPSPRSEPTGVDRRAADEPVTQPRLVWRGRLAIAGLLATGLLVTISAAHTQSFLPLSIRPAPSSLPSAAMS